MDDAFVRRRAARMAAQRPKSLAEGLRDGARNLGFSVAEGASGLLTSPLDGARRDGVKGAIVGVAQGVVGVALKPATGVLDLASKSTEAMRTTGVDSLEATGRARARPPRALGPRSTLEVYDPTKAALRDILLRVDAGAYRSEALIAHVGLGAHSVLCTELRLLHVRTTSLVKTWQARHLVSSRIDDLVPSRHAPHTSIIKQGGGILCPHSAPHPSPPAPSHHQASPSRPAPCALIQIPGSKSSPPGPI